MHLERAALEKAGCCNMNVSDDRKTSVVAVVFRLLSTSAQVISSIYRIGCNFLQITMIVSFEDDFWKMFVTEKNVLS